MYTSTDLQIAERDGLLIGFERNGSMLIGRIVNLYPISLAPEVWQVELKLSNRRVQTFRYQTV
jgi:hypothetical protein